MEPVIASIILKYPKGKRDNLLPLLQELQQETGHLSPDILQRVGDHLRLPINKILGVATFYDQFHLKQSGKFHIRVCRGTNCHFEKSATLLAEAEKVLKIKSGQTSRDGKFSLEVVTCIGACSNSPVISINGQFHAGLDPAGLSRLIRSLKG